MTCDSVVPLQYSAVQLNKQNQVNGCLLGINDLFSIPATFTLVFPLSHFLSTYIYRLLHAPNLASPLRLITFSTSFLFLTFAIIILFLPPLNIGAIILSLFASLLIIPQSFSLDLPYWPCCYLLPLQDGALVSINPLALLLDLFFLSPERTVSSNYHIQDKIQFLLHSTYS